MNADLIRLWGQLSLNILRSGGFWIEGSLSGPEIPGERGDFGCPKPLSKDPSESFDSLSVLVCGYLVVTEIPSCPNRNPTKAQFAFHASVSLLADSP